MSSSRSCVFELTLEPYSWRSCAFKLASELASGLGWLHLLLPFLIACLWWLYCCHYLHLECSGWQSSGLWNVASCCMAQSILLVAGMGHATAWSSLLLSSMFSSTLPSLSPYSIGAIMLAYHCQELTPWAWAHAWTLSYSSSLAGAVWGLGSWSVTMKLAIHLTSLDFQIWSIFKLSILKVLPAWLLA